MKRISTVYSKESSYFENAIKIYPEVKESMDNYDYWIRRKSLISTPGVLLLFLGIISLFWSYLIINLYVFEGKFVGCDENMLKLLNFNSVLIFIGDIPLFIVIIILGTIKIGSFISAYLCPSLLIKSSKVCAGHKIRRIVIT
jgi:hypothetical protein